jgi:hypothetical protein
MSHSTLSETQNARGHGVATYSLAALLLATVSLFTWSGVYAQQPAAPQAAPPPPTIGAGKFAAVTASAGDDRQTGRGNPTR